MRALLLIFLFTLSPYCLATETLKVATFNVSMEAGNYPEALTKTKNSQGAKQKPAPSIGVLQQVLSTGDHPQVKNVAEIIQRVRPDVLLLNEFDYIADKTKGVDAFISNYLNVSQNDQQAIDYPYTYIAPVNTGIATPFDLDNNGRAEELGGDAYGFGLYPGQYGMVLLSKYPIDINNIRTFQLFKWHHMPHPQQPYIPNRQQKETEWTPWYDTEEWEALRLSSKSHWDVPVLVNGEYIHILAMHPTPPSFDGEEDRNGKRNHDEIRLMADYLSPDKGSYIYDDNSKKVSLQKNARFILVGDFNAADIGDKYREGVIEQLTENPLVNNSVLPISRGGAESFSESYSNRYTASWGARADYVLPSAQFNITGAGVFWPTKNSELYRLVDGREASSDHRLVWVTLALKSAIKAQ